ncbi:ABC transporter substrate-binding protein [Bradyrhizobium genosp. P]|uniref:ABC transporter substrate-binding protein n=1 Tax=Bradyrhizobium genosp. P TaxID=83641 RepID=UPI003CE8EE46
MPNSKALQTLCLILFIVAGIADSGHAQISDDVIKIGVITDMTGPLASATGSGSVEAARMAAEEFGFSINGRPIEIVSADHQNKPDIGSAIVRRWFDVEHVDAVADIANSAVGFAIVEVARPRNKIVLIGAGSSDFTGKACAPTSIQWTWDTYGASTGTVKAIFGPGAETWFFITSDFAFGHALERDGAAAVAKLGGTVLGQVRPPFGTPDFSSFLLQAQRSKASVIAFATAGADTVNLMKQAAEFGLARPRIRVIPMQLMIDEVKAIGLDLGQGNYALMAFHHERSSEAKAWSQRFFERMHAMPTAIQAGTYSSVRHYLQAVKDIDTDEPLGVVAKMRATPINDMFASGGYIRQDGRMVHDMYLTQIKTPAESAGPWDLVKILKTIPGDEAFRPLSESECPLVRRPD